MNSQFKVSVIIPVYNAEKYIERAVSSANALSDVGEILIVDDGSTDESIPICIKLASTIDKLIILTHDQPGNKGPSASRNLGIKHSSFEYISFLDSDDQYLPNRFYFAKKVFEENIDADAVYGCNLEVFENENARELFMVRRSSVITTITELIAPERLYKCLLFGGYGEFHISTITIKKKAFEKTGLFNNNIRYGEDTELYVKLAVKCRLYPGDLYIPISVRHVHEHNSIHDWEVIDRVTEIVYQSLFDWILKQKVSFGMKNEFLSALYFQSQNKRKSIGGFLMKQVLRNPSIIFNKYIYRKTHLELVSRWK